MVSWSSMSRTLLQFTSQAPQAVQPCTSFAMPSDHCSLFSMRSLAMFSKPWPEQASKPYRAWMGQTSAKSQPHMREGRIHLHWPQWLQLSMVYRNRFRSDILPHLPQKHSLPGLRIPSGSKIFFSLRMASRDTGSV